MSGAPLFETVLKFKVDRYEYLLPIAISFFGGNNLLSGSNSTWQFLWLLAIILSWSRVYWLKSATKMLSVNENSVSITGPNFLISSDKIFHLRYMENIRALSQSFPDHQGPHGEKYVRPSGILFDYQGKHAEIGYKFKRFDDDAVVQKILDIQKTNQTN